MKIVDIRATTVAMPLEAPLRHAGGAHWGRFIRTIVEVVTDTGIVGLGELGGGGESAEAAVRGLLPYLKGHDPLQLEQLRWKIMNPTASLYNNRAQVHAAIEMACMDAAGKHLGIRACDLLGGAIREQVPFATYLFYRLPDDATGLGGETSPDEIVAQARDLVARHGFKSHKLKGGVFHPDHDIEVMRALGDAFPGDGLRLDPNAAWSVEQAIRVGKAIEHLNNDYFEDPTWGLEGMRRVRQFVRIPTATNTVVVNFEQLSQSIREQVPFATYLFYRLPDDATGLGGETSPDEIVAQARDLVARHGFKSHKLKGGVFHPDHDIEVMRALGDAFPGDGLRLDPNAAWSVEQAIRVGKAIEHLNNDYFEDPTWGLEGMRRVRQFVRIPTATNTVVVNFEQLSQSIRHDLIDVVLLDTTFWGGLRQAYKAGTVLETFQYGASVHSSGELGIQLASMLHLGAALPNLSFAADAHYHHLTDDVIVGGPMRYVNGQMQVPQGPGLGVELDRDKLAQYAEYYREVGGYSYDRDPTRPDWYAIVPESRWADPARR